MYLTDFSVIWQKGDDLTKVSENYQLEEKKCYNFFFAIICISQSCYHCMCKGRIVKNLFAASDTDVAKKNASNFILVTQTQLNKRKQFLKFQNKQKIIPHEKKKS